MKKMIKTIMSAGIVLLFAAAIFYCTVAGAPEEPERARRYIFASGAFSLLLPSFVCGCIHYISYLHSELEKYRKKNAGS